MGKKSDTDPEFLSAMHAMEAAFQLPWLIGSFTLDFNKPPPTAPTSSASQSSDVSALISQLPIGLINPRIKVHLAHDVLSNSIKDVTAWIIEVTPPGDKTAVLQAIEMSSTLIFSIMTTLSYIDPPTATPHMNAADVALVRLAEYDLKHGARRDDINQWVYSALSAVLVLGHAACEAYRVQSAGGVYDIQTFKLKPDNHGYRRQDVLQKIVKAQLCLRDPSQVPDSVATGG